MCEYIFSVSELRALINNAGVMIFGEFEWLTEQHMLKQIDVNLLGALRTTKSFCPMLRKYKGT
jgi:short-subunit dehydrogenase